MRSLVGALATLSLTVAFLACSQGGDEPEGGADASADGAKDATVDAPADARLDAGSDAFDGDASDVAAADAPGDAPCAPSVTITGSCSFVEAGYCLDYTGPWPENIAASACPEGGAFDWDASCPTQARTGSCYVDYQGGLGSAERCYPPLMAQQCQTVCSILDGGFCPN
jgi:hypothetical protein